LPSKKVGGGYTPASSTNMLFMEKIDFPNYPQKKRQS